MQAITTKFLPATNRSECRILAKCQANKLTTLWDPSSGVEDNHRAAAMMLAKRLGWLAYGQWIGGALPDDSGYAYVCATPVRIEVGP